ncbi:2-octaprenyl-6-methoxyphenyl hydroxylase [Marinobacterium zhoushanense]|uniref:2-octaprenyl-6-methoxyphenyl hydroxylase n=1 Tax=Marinobacterium zhoushanense TaxID=1679163 RepID=A0ABQ1KW76_9GAMM|nr:2-octaprenyl-6-methoxyphenyl hydroxylase [Marinobacterium zhoushanense]GGC09674.1 2-octaprenyl-6-methoxyphenyl hydroxylase [Marinobacterium zhoushanense]
MHAEYDLLIVGGGMVGASLACALLPVAAELQLRIAVVEAEPMPAADQPVFQPSYDARSTALAYGVRAAFERMGIWSTLAQHLTAIKHIHVSDRGHFGAARLDAQREQVPALGYVVENHWLGQVLLSRLRQDGAPWIDFISPAEVVDLDNRAEGCTVRVVQGEDERELKAGLVVMADGGRSALREKIGIGYRQSSYEQHALVANVSLDRPHRNIAYERFTDSGPIALLPGEDLDGQARCGLVWTLPEEAVDEVLALDQRAFLDRLQQRFGYRAGRLTRVGERYHYPLKLVVAEEQVRAGLVVLGNAAHALHPIAGQGFNLAFRGVVALADLIIQRHREKLALGELQALQDFEQSRRSDQFRTIGFSDRTMKLFTSSQPALTLTRDIGLALLDICPLGKTLLARAAMGLDHPAPRLH